MFFLFFQAKVPAIGEQKCSVLVQESAGQVQTPQDVAIRQQSVRPAGRTRLICAQI